MAKTVQKEINIEKENVIKVTKEPMKKKKNRRRKKSVYVSITLSVDFPRANIGSYQSCYWASL